MAELPNIEDSVRRRMRRQQFANTLVIMVFALAIVAVAAWFVERGRLLHRPAPPTIAATPASVAQTTAPTPEPPTPQPAVEKKPKPQAPPSRRVEAMHSLPAPAAAPPAPDTLAQPPTSPASRSAYEMPGATGATRVLVGIKCVDDLRYEGEAQGRHYFSARCQSGARRTVSCIGGGCKIEYAPPPSHLP